LSESVKVVEKKALPANALMFYGLPDVGLVGLIATSHMISKLELIEVAHVTSDLLPPMVVLHEGLPYSPLRLFGKNDLVALISETPIPAEAIQPLMRSLIDWSVLKKPKMLVSLGGMPVPNRQDVTEPRVFGAATNKSLLDTLSEKGVKIVKGGFLVGPQALVMQYCAERGVPAIILLAESFYNYPDPEAAAAAIKELNKITDLSIDVSELFEKGEEIRLKARDLMRRTQPEMAHMKKSREYDLPLYV
jgi:uncharacterized protein